MSVLLEEHKQRMVAVEETDVAITMVPAGGGSSDHQILIIPAGTPHKWDYAEEFTSYVVMRMDPEGVAPLLDVGAAEFIPPTP